MVEKLTFWLLSIFEDDPLPDEINVLLFNVKTNGKYKYLEVKGYENFICDNSNSFFPLEAQFFDCLELAKLDDKKFYLRSKYIIEEAFSNNELKYILKKIKIYIRMNNSLEYLFTV